MYEFKIPEDVPEALQEIHKLLRTAMREVDGMRQTTTDEGTHAKLTDINSAMADSHMLCTWIRDRVKGERK
jgi:hypothetical protein